MIKDAKGSVENAVQDSGVECLRYLEARKMDLGQQEMLSVDAANSLMSTLRAQLEPFRFVVDENSPWEEKSAAVRLTCKMKKSIRNKLWKKRKRRCAAEMRAKVDLFALFSLYCSVAVVELLTLSSCLNGFRSLKDLNKLIERQMNGGKRKWPRTWQIERL